MLAACDNFRAGAVEQIKTHGRNLDIPVFDRGYKEEPSNIAFEAIRDVKIYYYTGNPKAYWCRTHWYCRQNAR